MMPDPGICKGCLIAKLQVHEDEENIDATYIANSLGHGAVQV
jgi:hypothetical protein